MRSLPALALLALAACVPPRVRVQLTGLEARVAELETAQERDNSVMEALFEGAMPNPDQAAREEAAGELFQQMAQAVEKNDYDTAKALANELVEDYPDTEAGRTARYYADELAVLGTQVDTLAVDRWYQGSAPDLTQGTTLVVFFETWCPHCQREVPKLQATSTRFADQGLSVVGLTKQTRGVTDAQVEAFIADHQLTYPVGKETDGSTSALFGVSGIPAAAVVQHGSIVWRGHPAQLTDAQIAGFLAK